MQERGILHRDLKLSNILVTPYNQLKIIDFGLAVQLTDLSEERTTLCGTPNYISPEVLHTNPYGLSADLWSLGCIYYALITGTPPFECPTVQQTLLRVKEGEFVMPKYVGEQAGDLIKKLLNPDPIKRVNIVDVLRHPFITIYNGEFQFKSQKEKAFEEQKFETI